MAQHHPDGQGPPSVQPTTCSAPGGPIQAWGAQPPPLMAAAIDVGVVVGSPFPMAQMLSREPEPTLIAHCAECNARFTSHEPPTAVVNERLLQQLFEHARANHAIPGGPPSNDSDFDPHPVACPEAFLDFPGRALVDDAGSMFLVVVFHGRRGVERLPIFAARYRCRRPDCRAALTRDTVASHMSTFHGVTDGVDFVSPGTRRWRNGLCECNAKTASYCALCGPCLVGQLSDVLSSWPYIIGLPQTDANAPSEMLPGTRLRKFRTDSAVLCRTSPTCVLSVVMCIMQICPQFWCIQLCMGPMTMEYRLRRLVVNRYRLDESRCQSCLVSYVCCPCSLCQIVNELDADGLTSGQLCCCTASTMPPLPGGVR